MKNDDMLGNSQLRLTVALPVSKTTSVKLYSSTGTGTRTGTNYDLLGAALQYRW